VIKTLYLIAVSSRTPKSALEKKIHNIQTRNQENKSERVRGLVDNYRGVNSKRLESGSGLEVDWKRSTGQRIQKGGLQLEVWLRNYGSGWSSETSRLTLWQWHKTCRATIYLSSNGPNCSNNPHFSRHIGNRCKCGTDGCHSAQTTIAKVLNKHYYKLKKRALKKPNQKPTERA